MVFEWATEGPYAGGVVYFMTDYKGYKVYYISPPLNMYACVDPAGVEQNVFNEDIVGVYNWIDNQVVDPVFIEDYRGYKVYQEPSGLKRYYGIIDTTETSYWLTLEGLRGYIDELLGPDLTEKVLHSTYRDIEIYRFVVSKVFTFTTEVGTFRSSLLETIISIIDEVLGPTLLPDEYVTSWGEYSIWKSGTTGMYYVIVDELAQGEFETVQQAKDYIEDVLGHDPDAPLIVPGDEPDYTPMDPDHSRAALISGPVNQFLASVGLTEEALDVVKGSGADPAKAAAYAKSVAMASVGAVAILGTIGVVAEVASLGQVETVATTIDMVLEKTGISGLLDELFRLPFMSALVTPARHHWNSVYTPELSGLSQITRELVREVISLDTYLKEAAMQGLSNERAMRVWDSHWRELGIRDTDTILHRGGMLEEEWEKYRVIQDYRPDPRPGFRFSDLAMSKVLRKTLLGRVDTRRAYQYGYMDRTKLIEMYQYQGYEEDSELQTDIQIRASVDGLQSAIRREEGMMYRDRLKDAREDESAAVGTILRERDAELTVILLRWNIENIPEIDLMLIPDEYKDRAAELGPLTEEEALVIEADLRSKAETAIATVRTAARAREEEAEATYRTALETVGDIIDPIELWILRYKLAAARVEVAGEFEIEPPTIVTETAEEPE